MMARQKQDLDVLQLNTHGLIGKEKELSRLLFDILRRSSVDVVILCEAWLTKESEKWVSFPGDIYHGIDRKHKKKPCDGLRWFKLKDVKMQY